MSAQREYATVWVCVDCYIAHHYGVTEHKGKFYAGESDAPADNEPLGLLGVDVEVADKADPESGIAEFSWHRCEGCGSMLGGARYRLAVWER